MSLFPKLAVANDESRKRLVDALLHRAKGKGIGVELTENAAEQGGGLYNQDARTVEVSP